MLQSDTRVFENWENVLDGMFDRRATLPEQVFRRSLSFRFSDFQNFERGEFWALMSQIATLVDQGPLDIVTCALQPYAREYYQQYGLYGAFATRSSDSEHTYLDILRHGPPQNRADSIQAGAVALCWFTETTRWGIWADRDYELMVVGLPLGTDWNQLRITRPYLATAKEVASSLTFFPPKSMTAPQFIDSLAANYPT